MNLEHIYEFFRHRPPTYLGQELAVCYVLSVLVEKESYGTELISLLETEHPRYRLSDTVLYSAIKFLEDEKAVTGYWKKAGRVEQVSLKLASTGDNDVSIWVKAHRDEILELRKAIPFVAASDRE